MPQWDYRRTWYHGSPHRLTTLRTGSTITQDRHLATVFSHKPTVVSISGREIRHNGTQPGFLYRIAEEIGPRDAHPHPRTTMEPGQEWLTDRELRLELIGPTEVVEAELLTEEELRELERRASLRKRRSA